MRVGWREVFFFDKKLNRERADLFGKNHVGGHATDVFLKPFDLQRLAALTCYAQTFVRAAEVAVPMRKLWVVNNFELGTPRKQ